MSFVYIVSCFLPPRSVQISGVSSPPNFLKSTLQLLTTLMKQKPTKYEQKLTQYCSLNEAQSAMIVFWCGGGRLATLNSCLPCPPRAQHFGQLLHTRHASYSVTTPRRLTFLIYTTLEFRQSSSHPQMCPFMARNCVVLAVHAVML